MSSNAGDTRQRAWDHTSHPDFYDYYAEASESRETALRFSGVQSAVLRIMGHAADAQLDVADIGCGAGTQSRLWAASGHRVYGLDVNAPLLELARERAARQGLDISFEVGSATALPWGAHSMDVCLLPELLEHVADWQSCLAEAARVLRPGGVLYASTTNVLCPKQQEFNLPLYSWYPGRLKRYFERAATTTRPDLANYARYPAVHWFSFYGLRAFLQPLGFSCFDRFDLIDDAAKGTAARTIVAAIRRVPALRFLGHVATPWTAIVAVKGGREATRQPAANGH
jgi:2-polyprenyl-6-hydroxyphenyl methylase/3-demethylubiquinone-9 3-methyltransferase